ncbi:MAG TPA: hypothetical protein VHM90_08320 [Phycisphaerae bacterium]|jgi:DNA-directed RNA polymerase subunit RPC12/RpoP|nr:hypothetical protein [Phycisphaerae bacterium]
MDYEIKRHLVGKPTVSFNCQSCSDELQCPLDDAGTEQRCPRCGTPFITPGQKELDEQRRQAQEEEENREHAEYEKRQKAFREQEERHRLKQREAAAAQPPEPEMVWYGDMLCETCGYQWQARRNTPPARCPSCSKRSVLPIKRPKRTAGCAAILLFFFLLLPLLAHGINRLM